ncbi:MAG: hypothetical protein GVY22_19525 [Gammaproteobacteria bacterium]|nr:hypothetical protein [Gammaproteobacteria bacterium]
MPRISPALLRHAAASLLAILVASPAALGADPVLDQIDTARRAYADGDRGVAIEALNVAIAQIRRQQTEQQLRLFPQPLPGWSAEDASAQSGGLAAALTGKMLTRSYTNDDSGAEVTMTISANSPFMGFVSGLMQMPLLAQGGDGLGTYVYEGYRGLLEPSDEGSAKLSLIIGNNILLQLDGRQGAGADTLKAYLEATDLEALEKAFEG